MILERIELDNIRSYEHACIDFPLGNSLFEGDVGSGKSTVLMGIEFALFGLGSVQADGLLSKRATSGSVVLRFRSGDRQYEIKRAIKSTVKDGEKSASQDSKESYLLDNGVRRDLSPSDLKLQIIKILRLKEPGHSTAVSRIFRYAVFTPQEEMKEILRDKKARLETIRRAFGIEEYKIAADNASDLKREIADDIRVLKERFRDLDSHLKEREEEASRADNLRLKVSNLEDEKEQSLHAEYSAKAKLDSLREKQQEKAGLEADGENLLRMIRQEEESQKRSTEKIAGTEAEIESICEKISELEGRRRPTAKSQDQIQAEIDRYSGLSREIERLESDARHLRDHIESLVKDLGAYADETAGTLEARRNTLDLEIRHHEEEKERLEASRSEREHDAAAQGALINHLEEQKMNLTGQRSKCTMCLQELTPEYLEKQRNAVDADLSEKRSLLDKARKDSERIQSEISALKPKIAGAREDLDQIDNAVRALEEINDSESRLTKTESDISDLKVQNLVEEEASFPNYNLGPADYMRALKEELVRFEEAQKLINSHRERREDHENSLASYRAQISESEAKVADYCREYSSISERLEEFGDLDGQASIADAELSRIHNVVVDTSSRISSSIAELNGVEKEIEWLDSIISAETDNQQRHQRFYNYHTWLTDYFIPSVEKIEKEMLLSIQQKFDDAYRGWYDKLIDDHTKTSRIDEEFTPIVEQDGYLQNLDYMSGGEKTSIALAYRLTLNMLMRQETDTMKSGLLILDEPTDGFSKTQLQKLKPMLEEIGSEQIILVSHERELESFVNTVFYISKSGGISSITENSN